LKSLLLQQVSRRNGCNMIISHASQTNRICTSPFYHRDPTVPFWRFNVDADALFEAHAHRPDRAQAWLRYRDVSENCLGFRRAVMMRGHFEEGLLGNHTYCWTFTPTYSADLAIVLPVFHECRLSDFVAMSRHNHEIWGCCTGTGQYLGEIKAPLRIHRSLAGWLANDCDGILPLTKSFFPHLQNAASIIAEDDDHAWDLAHRIFIDPAARFGSDQEVAEQLSYNRIEVRS
jgi:hypothetical protein